MAQQSLLIMTSRWRNMEIIWCGPNDWLMVHDRPCGRLTDREALDFFGDEAFRRRDELIAKGERVYSPALSQLVSRRVVAALGRAGWEIVTDAMCEHEGATFCARRGLTELSISVPSDDRWSLRLQSRDGVIRSESIAEAESWLLSQAKLARAANHTRGIILAEDLQ